MSDHGARADERFDLFDVPAHLPTDPLRAARELAAPVIELQLQASTYARVQIDHRAGGYARGPLSPGSTGFRG
jgi:hypothetical protein